MGDLSPDQFPHFDCDPRRDLSPEALEAATLNAFPLVATARRRRDRGGLLLGLGLALGLGAITFVSLSGTAKEKASPPTPLQHVPITMPPQDASPASAPAPAPAVVAAPTPRQAAILAMPPGTPAKFEAIAVSPVMVYDTSASADPAQPLRTTASTGPAASPSTAGLNENEAFGSRMGSAGFETASAARMIDPANTITQGTLIPAILETAIDSDLPGYVRAVVSQDLRSFDGSRLLVPRSSRLIGQYKSGLAAGQTRVYVIWTRLIRPDGVSVALASPAVEESGRSGLSGKVSEHFFKRFGGASLLSVFGGLGALATGSAAGVLIAANAQSAASVVATRDGQTPPTVQVQPGQPVRVFTARDLDFSGVVQ